MTETPEPLPLDKLVARWRMALGPEGSATHAGSVQVPADDLRRLVEALAESMEGPVFVPTMTDYTPEDMERLKEYVGRLRPAAYLPFHEEGVKTQFKPRPFLRPALDAFKAMDVPTVDTYDGVPLAELDDEKVREAFRWAWRKKCSELIMPEHLRAEDATLTEMKRRGLTPTEDDFAFIRGDVAAPQPGKPNP